ncbi:MAG TPA: hypothetical protein VHV51_24505, partial [Polyangiaceae bacterium]|nr:hypothetical protein [Polyangiaceae bacterium]
MRRVSRLFLGLLALLVAALACSASTGPSATRAETGGSAGTVGASGESANGGSATSNAGAANGGSATAGAMNQAGATNNAGSSAAGNSAGGASNAGGNGANNAGSANGGSGPALRCGYMNQGHVLDVAPGIELCIPPQNCLPETCPPTLGSCVNNACVYDAGYDGVQTLPEAWATHYCDLQSGACQGVHQLDPVLTTAQNLASQSSLPLCKSASAGSTCVGIVAIPPMMEGNREKFGENWGLGLTEPSGLCYQVTGPGGSALLAVTDRCGGYCKCPS